MSESKNAFYRRYVVLNADGKECLVKAVSPAEAIKSLYDTKCRLASGDDIERLTLSQFAEGKGRSVP